MNTFFFYYSNSFNNTLLIKIKHALKFPKAFSNGEDLNTSMNRF